MIEQIVNATKGLPTLLAGNKALHSRYDPYREAERFISTLSIPDNTDCFILLEPGLNYLSSLLRKKYPDKNIIILHCSSFFKDNPGYYTCTDKDAVWYYDSTQRLSDFLEQNIQETASCQLIQWRSAASIYKSEYLSILKAVSEFLQREAANKRTLTVVGRLWIKNFFKALNTSFYPLTVQKGSSAVILCAAGPSLETSLPEIKRQINKYFVIAVSSAVGALYKAGIQPDLVISTDAGQWAKFHLNEVFRNTKRIMFSAPLSSALSSQCYDNPLLVQSDGSIWQNALLSRLEIPFINLKQRGTVSASALDVALTISNGPVFLAGFDMLFKDIQTHARPYSLNFFLESVESRLRPMYSEQFKRASTIRDGNAYTIYGQWFRQKIPSLVNRVCILGTKNPFFKELESYEQLPKTSSNTIKPHLAEMELPVSTSTREALVLLSQILVESRIGPGMCNELSILLNLANKEPDTVQKAVFDCCGVNPFDE